MTPEQLAIKHRRALKHVERSMLNLSIALRGRYLDATTCHYNVVGFGPPASPSGRSFVADLASAGYLETKTFGRATYFRDTDKLTRWAKAHPQYNEARSHFTIPA
jgi:hypothetical protein